LGGAGAGLAVGELGRSIIAQVYPDIPFQAPWWALLAAPTIALTTAVLFTVAPARRAARLDPVQALSRR
jgi:putative ABC transport system permease protein